MKTREEHLESCKICQKRKFSMQKGIVCSLTDEWADFDNECPTFEKDEIAAIQEANSEIARQEMALENETAGLHIFGVKNGAVAGVLIIALAIAWIILGIVSMGVIYYYAIAIIFLGIALIVRHYRNTIKKKKQNKFSRKEDILDSEF